MLKARSVENTRIFLGEEMTGGKTRLEQGTTHSWKMKRQAHLGLQGTDN